MYKITRVEEVSRNTLKPLSFNINKYINEELQEDEFLLHIEYFVNVNLNMTKKFKIKMYILFI